MKTILFIDTSDNKLVKVGLHIDGKEYIETQIPDHRKAQLVLPMAQRLLHEHNLVFNDLTGIDVNVGPGSFTGLRVGVAIANALGFLLKIPINGKKVGEMAEPIYDDR